MVALPWGNVRSGMTKLKSNILNSPPPRFNICFAVWAATAARPAFSWLPCACASARTALGDCYCPCALSTALWAVHDAPRPTQHPQTHPPACSCARAAPLCVLLAVFCGYWTTVVGPIPTWTSVQPPTTVLRQGGDASCRYGGAVGGNTDGGRGGWNGEGG